MDLLGTNPVFNLYDKEWRIYSKSPIMPPHYAGADAVISNSLVTEGCVVHGLVRHQRALCRAFASNPARSWRIQL